MKLSDYVVGFLAGQGVRHVFEVIGGAIAHLLDSTYDRADIRCVSVRHEQAAAFAAEGVARYSGNLGVAMATSGPGATNLVTGIGSAYFDSAPCLYITGQVNTYEYKYDRPVRQIGFQETDIVSIVRPIVKYAAFVDDPLRIRYELEKAAHVARSGRPGRSCWTSRWTFSGRRSTRTRWRPSLARRSTGKGRRTPLRRRETSRRPCANCSLRNARSSSREEACGCPGGPGSWPGSRTEAARRWR